MTDRDDETGLPLPPKPPAPPEPHVLPAMPPSFAPSGPPGPPSFPPDFKSRRVDSSDAPPNAYTFTSPPVRVGLFAIAGVVIVFLGILAFVLLSSSASPHVVQGPAGIEQTIELPPGQRLIHAEIGQGGEVYYRYTADAARRTSAVVHVRGTLEHRRSARHDPLHRTRGGVSSAPPEYEHPTGSPAGCCTSLLNP